MSHDEQLEGDVTPETAEDETRPPAWLTWIYVAYILWAGAYLGLYIFGS
jgi:hypothetical protein